MRPEDVSSAAMAQWAAKDAVQNSRTPATPLGQQPLNPDFYKNKAGQSTTFGVSPSGSQAGQMTAGRTMLGTKPNAFQKAASRRGVDLQSPLTKRDNAMESARQGFESSLLSNYVRDKYQPVKYESGPSGMEKWLASDVYKENGPLGTPAAGSVPLVNWNSDATGFDKFGQDFMKGWNDPFEMSGLQDRTMTSRFYKGKGEKGEDYYGNT